MINIEKLLEKNKAFVSPLAGYTDAIFRDYCLKFGAALTYSEMVSAKGVYYNSENTFDLLKNFNNNSFALQIFGSDPKIMGEVVKKLSINKNILLVDINMGCPANKITKNGEGSALMTNTKLAYEVTKSVVENSKKPVTVKFRSGYRNDKINAVEFAKVIESAGAKMITVHGRTAEQMYTGKVDLDIIAKVKNEVRIPVLANGDVKTLEDYIRTLSYTKCDGVMIGRGVIGNPFIFREIYNYENGLARYETSYKEKLNIAIEQHEKACSFYGSVKGNKEMRKHILAYLKGIPNSIRVKDLITRENDSEKARLILKNFSDSLALKNEF